MPYFPEGQTIPPVHDLTEYTSERFSRSTNHIIRTTLAIF